MSNLAFSSIVFPMIFRAPEIIRAGIFVFFLQRSSIKDFKLLKGESNTAAVSDGECLA